jgi:hypothetical protein
VLGHRAEIVNALRGIVPGEGVIESERERLVVRVIQNEG